MIEYGGPITSSQHDENKKKLLKLGVLDVKRESIVQRAVKTSSFAVSNKDVNSDKLVDTFVHHVRSSLASTKLKQGKEWQLFFDNDKMLNLVISKGKQIMNNVQKVHESNQIQKEGPIFVADLHKLVISDFLGVQGNIVLKLTVTYYRYYRNQFLSNVGWHMDYRGC